MAIDAVFVLIVTLIRLKYLTTRMALEMLKVVLVAQCSDVGPTQRAVACVTYKTQFLEVIVLAEWYLDNGIIF